jgi:2-C-methyl-D-erythritol 2,4-cyclodiphosphate synthase
MSLRIGQGYDSHALVPDRQLYIGGVAIDFEKGALGHSDGDCLLHALIDSILGALGQGDIGLWFPDTAPELKDVRSTHLLEKVITDPNLPKFEINNLDLTVFLNAPKMKPHRETIIESISTLLKIDPSQVNLKAKTLEGFQTTDLIVSSATCLLQLI